MIQPGPGVPTGEAAGRSLSVAALGRVDPRAIECLGRFFPVVEQLDSGLPPDASLAGNGAALNRAIDAAAGNWILILREHESVADELAQELAAAVSEPPLAWGYRIHSDLIYCGRRLRLEKNRGEIRLFNRRHARFDLRTPEREIKVQGTVIRFRQRLRRGTFASAAEHRAHLERDGIPHSLLRRVLLFLHSAMMTGAIWRSLTTLRYLWIEAGYDRDEK